MWHKYEGHSKLVILMSGVFSLTFNSIPSPQCALGTTPHLSIQKVANEGR